MQTVLFVGKIKEDTKPRFEALDGYTFHFFSNFEEVPDAVFEKTNILIGQITEQAYAKMSNLQMVQLLSAGVECLWLPEHITLANAYSAYGPGIAEYMVATSLSLLKGLPFYYHQQKQHDWRMNTNGKAITQIKVLSVGMGSIGSAFLKNMHFLGATCYGVKRTLSEKPDYVEELYTLDTMDAILPHCDIVALSLPETEATTHIFDEATLRKLSRDAILLNVGRGSAIVTEDLIRVVKDGYFKGVYLDVVDPEPLPKNHPLWNMERVFITPHISGRYISDVHYERVIDVIYENLVRNQASEPLLHTIDRSLGY